MKDHALDARVLLDGLETTAELAHAQPLPAEEPLPHGHRRIWQRRHVLLDEERHVVGRPPEPRPQAADQPPQAAERKQEHPFTPRTLSSSRGPLDGAECYGR